MNEKKDQIQRQCDFVEIINHIRFNPQKGLEAFYKKYGKLVVTTAKVFCDRDCVDEVVNDVLIKVWKSARRLKGIKNPEGWIYIVTINVIKSRVRKQACVALNEEILSKEDIIENLIEEDSFYSLIKNCTEIEKQIIIQKFIAKSTFQEIAQAIQMPLSSITTIYYRALKKIEKTIEKRK